MDDLISRDALKDALAKHLPFAVVTLDDLAFASGLDAAYVAVKNAATIDPVRHARWVSDKGISECSGCGGEQMYNDWDELQFTPYCHSCGARMDGGETKGILRFSTTHCCIVFSPHRISAIQKLEEIAVNRTVERKVNSYDVRYILDDEEEWIWVNPESDKARGYRAHKALVDVACSQRALNQIVLPACSTYCPEIEYYTFK